MSLQGNNQGGVLRVGEAEEPREALLKSTATHPEDRVRCLQPQTTRSDAL